MQTRRRFEAAVWALACAALVCGSWSGSVAGEPAGASLPAFTGGAPITAGAPKDAVPFVTPNRNWPRFVILIWQYKTRARQDFELYRKAGFWGFHIDRGHGQDATVAFARDNKMPYYVDHAADKGYLHLTDRTGKGRILRKRGIVRRPHCLVDPKLLDLLKGHLKRNVTTTKAGPVVAYAFDDEISLGSFNSPAEVDGSPLSVEAYRRWLKQQYATPDALSLQWGRQVGSFADAQPVSFEAVRGAHTKAPFAKWNLSYMDTQFADCLAELSRYTNTLDPATPSGFVGGQQAAPYGGYDYSKVCRAVQWIEAYDIGGSCEILRSLWCAPHRRPYVQTWFSSGEAKRDAWFLWYYLVHGNRGVIAWPDRGGSWFHYKSGGIAPFIAANARAIREVQGDVSGPLLDPKTRFDPDPIAVYYSHRSIQASWAMDVVTHGGTWPNRSSSLDNKCQSAGKNRVAWFKLLEDCGFQYNVVTARQVTADHLIKNGYRVLILNRAVALSDAEAAAVRRFVRAGGTVIADYLTGVLDGRGKGRRTGGALDKLFGIKRDEEEGYLNGKSITEIDGEKYNRPFVQRLMYDGAIRHRGIVVYERGTKAAAGIAKAAARAGSADVVIVRRAGRGKTVYLNLTPVEYYDMDRRIGAYGQTWRTLMTNVLAASGLHPRAQVLADGKPVPLAELLYWRNADRLFICAVKNPTRQGSITGAGKIHGVTGQPISVTLRFRTPLKSPRNLRTGTDLPRGNDINIKWNPCEALVFEAEAP